MGHDSPRTDQSCFQWVRHYIVSHGRCHLHTIGEAEMHTCLSYAVSVLEVSTVTQNQAKTEQLF